MLWIKLKLTVFRILSIKQYPWLAFTLAILSWTCHSVPVRLESLVDWRILHIRMCIMIIIKYLHVNLIQFGIMFCTVGANVLSSFKLPLDGL